MSAPTDPPTNRGGNDPAGDSPTILDQLYQGLGQVGAQHQQVLAELEQLREQLAERDQQLTAARAHAEQTGDQQALREIEAEQDELTRAWRQIAEHLDDDTTSSSS